MFDRGISSRRGVLLPGDPSNQLTFGTKDTSTIISLMDDYDKEMFSYLVKLNSILGRDYIDLNQYENVLDYLQRTNIENEYDYLNSLLHPERCKGLKIPSPIPVPSCAFQLHNTVTLTTNASGNLCFLFNPFYLYDKNILNQSVFKLTPNSGVEQTGLFNYCTSLFVNQSADLDGFTPNVGGWVPVNIGQGIPSVYNQYRLVSASLVVRYIGRMDITSGVIGGAIIYDEGIYPGGLMTYTVESQDYSFYNRPPGLFKYSNFDLAMDSFYHQERNCIQGLREIYFPLDNTYEEYQKMASPSDVKNFNQVVVANDGTSSGLPSVPVFIDTKKGFQKMVYVLGAPPNSACFKVDIYCNFETLPNAEFLNYMPISLSPKTISPEMKKQSIAYVQKQPITDLSEKTKWFGSTSKGLLEGLKSIFKSGIPKKILIEAATTFLPYYKPALSLFNIFSSSQQGNINKSFANENTSAQAMVENAEMTQG